MTDTFPITVLLSVYNGERWLNECIDSVLAQSFSEFEFLIIDDGSTDSSIDILLSKRVADKRIRVITKQNSGLADSLNHGLITSRGTWIARLDADDTAREDRLARQLDFATSSDNIVYVGSGCHIVDESGTQKQTTLYPEADSKLKQLLYSGRKFPPHSSAFYRRDLALSVGGYRKRIRRSEDTDLWLRLSVHGEFRSVPEPLVSLRHHGEQITCRYQNEMIIDSFVAHTSHAIANAKRPDPVDADDKTFARFKAFIQTSLESEQYHARVLKYQSCANSLKDCIRSADVFSLPNSFIKYILASTNLPKGTFSRREAALSLAEKWVASEYS
jgi:glycosyltransferase involved in cell wall biosynthesis